MAQPESNLQKLQEELEQITRWLSEEGLPPDSPRETQLCLLWRSFQSTRSHLSSVSLDLDTQRSKHLAEMAEVRKSLEQIRIFTEHKDALAQEIQDENDQLKEQLRQMISLQDSQISEVAKMLYQQGLTELIHSSPSEQVAYLLVERASLLETSEAPDKLTGDGNSTGLLETETQVLKTAASQADSRHLAGQVSSVKKECSRLERDLEEGSRRLAMAHSEIRHLTDELESAHLTQRAYEPELQAAQHEVQQLRQEVKKLKKYEMAELRKTKELNDRLDLEIRALRNRIRSLDAEKSSLQQTVVSQQETVMRLELALTEQRSELQQLAEQIEASQADELAEESPTGFWMHSKTQLDNQPHQKEWGQKEAMSQHCEETQCQHKDSFASEEMLEKQLKLMKNKESSQKKTSSSYQKAVNNLLATQDKCETLKKEICETLRWLDRERSKYHEMREKHKAKLCRTKQKFEEEIAWRDEKMGNLERELSLCSHSLQKEKELTRSITVENDKLLDERRKLLQQLNEEEHNRKDNRLTASLSKCRMDFLEMENRKLEKKVLHVSSQLAVLERRLQNRESADPAEELKVSTNMQSFPPLSVPTLSVAVNKPEEIAGDTHVTSAPPIFLSRPAEMGYLNLTPSRNHSDVSAPSVLIGGSGGTCC